MFIVYTIGTKGAISQEKFQQPGTFPSLMHKKKKDCAAEHAGSNQMPPTYPKSRFPYVSKGVAYEIKRQN